jgi:hypothetical protein
MKLKSGVALNKNFLAKANNITKNHTFFYEFPIVSQIESRSYIADAAIEFQFGTFTLHRDIPIIPTYNALVSIIPEFKIPTRHIQLSKVLEYQSEGML